MRPRTGKARNSRAARVPTWKAPACRTRIATEGSARAVTWVPASLTAWPVQSSRKPRSRQRRPPSARWRNVGAAIKTGMVACADAYADHDQGRLPRAEQEDAQEPPRRLPRGGLLAGYRVPGRRRLRDPRA